MAVDDLIAAVRAASRRCLFGSGLAVLPLSAPADSPPLWALYSTGMRNYDLDPVPSHFLAIFTKDDAGWQELARIDLDAPPAEDTLLVEPLPDYIDPAACSRWPSSPAASG